MTSGSQIRSALIREALKRGATSAKIISAGKVVVDRRARLKCLVPICPSYGRHLMCPPNIMSVQEFEQILGLYEHALIVQVQTDFDSRDKSTRRLTKELCQRLENTTGTLRWQRKLHSLVNDLEASAFKRGFRFAAGFIGGECVLCDECNALLRDRQCAHPFLARPSMEAVGIDVVKTCENAGLSVHLSSKDKVRWTGLILLD
jgi:predicted metal-binding protein